MIWANLLAIPVLVILTMLQVGIVSRLPLLQGTADLLLLAIIAWTLQKRVQNGWFWGAMAGALVGLTSAVAPVISIISYLLVIALVQFFKRQVWQAPLLVMLLLTLISTILQHGLTMANLILQGTSIPILDSFSLITLPSILLNLVLAVPFYAFMSDMANWLFPEEIEG
jgi:cell shape-determining protein MreD